MNHPITFTFRESILALTAIKVYRGLPQCLSDDAELKALADKIEAAYVDEDEEVSA